MKIRKKNLKNRYIEQERIKKNISRIESSFLWMEIRNSFFFKKKNLFQSKNQMAGKWFKWMNSRHQSGSRCAKWWCVCIQKKDLSLLIRNKYRKRKKDEEKKLENHNTRLAIKLNGNHINDIYVSFFVVHLLCGWMYGWMVEWVCKPERCSDFFFSLS